MEMFSGSQKNLFLVLGIIIVIAIVALYFLIPKEGPLAGMGAGSGAPEPNPDEYDECIADGFDTDFCLNCDLLNNCPQ